MSENIPKTAEEFDRRFDEGEDIFSLGMDPSKGIHVDESKNLCSSLSKAIQHESCALDQILTS